MRILNLISGFWKNSPCPLLWVLLAGFLVFVFLGAISRKWTKVLSVNLAIIFFFALAVEFAFSDKNPLSERFSPASSQTWRDGKSVFTNELVLGYGPVTGSFAVKKTKRDGTVVYDVAYSIDENASRIAPFAYKAGRPIVLFMGCSFTFGEGLNDSEAFPAQFQKLTAEKFSSYNLGFSGYGPHQALRRLETGYKLDFIAKKPVAHIVFLSLPYHDERVGGFAPWDFRGPHYELTDAGKPEFQGPFLNDAQISRNEKLNKSFFYQWFHETWLGYRKSRSEEIQRDRAKTLAILSEMQRLAKDKYGAHFHVMTWWKKSEGREQFEKQLTLRGIHTISISKILPDFDSSPQYTIVGDGSLANGDPNSHAHPNALAASKIAGYLSQVLDAL